MKKIIITALVAVLSLNITGAVCAEYDRSDFDAKYDELDFLIKQCENSGINVDAERVMATTVKRFTDNIVFDAMLDENLRNEGTSLKEKTNRSISYQESALNGLYERAKTNMEGYIKGEKASTSVDSSYNPTLLKITGDGVCIENEPYYSMGYGHFDSVLKDIPVMESMGADHVAMETGPYNVLEVVSEGNKTYTNSGSKRDNTVAYIQDILSRADESGIGVNLLLSPHYVPEWFLKWYPELENVSAGWCGYNIFDDKSKQMISDYLAGVLPALKEFTSLESIILTNEPHLNTYHYPDTFKIDFNRYLMNKYGKISLLNEAWGTSYTSWSSINMPQYDTNTGLPLTYDALFYDWYIYNDEKFAQWHEWMASEVRKHLPDVKISIKTLDYLWCDDNVDEYRLRGISGNDVERYAEFCDFAGVDAHGNISDYNQIISKYMYYDFVRSVTGQPIYNSEDHMFYDSYKKFGDKEPVQDEHVSTSIWQGAIHGMEKTTLWTWQRLDYIPSGGETWTDAVDRELKSIYNATFLHRPEAAAAAGITAVDLRRLNDEVRTLELSENDTAILYSKSARIYNLDFIKTMHSAYETMLATGFGVDFVTEYKPERMHEYKTLILTGVDNIESNTLKELSKFSGNIILMNSSISNNQYNQPGDSALISDIMNSKKTQIITDSADEFHTALVNADERKAKAELTDADGNFVKGLDFKWAELYDGATLINICNLSNADIKNLTLRVNGEEISAEDLINGTVIEPGFTAKRYVPVMIYIPGNGSLLRNIAVKNGKTITWKREIFPTYIYNIDDGMENKYLVGIEDGRFEAKKEGIYYLRKSDSGTVYPGRIISLQTGNLFEVSEAENGFAVRNVSGKYAAGIAKINYSNSAFSFVDLYLEPGESRFIETENVSGLVVYNNLSDMIKVSN